jgi:hypothetical protein
LSRHEVWQARAVGELEQLKQNIRHFTIEVSVATNIFYFTTKINEIIPFLFFENVCIRWTITDQLLVLRIPVMNFIFYLKYSSFLPW